MTANGAEPAEAGVDQAVDAGPAPASLVADIENAPIDTDVAAQVTDRAASSAGEAVDAGPPHDALLEDVEGVLATPDLDSAADTEDRRDDASDAVAADAGAPPPGLTDEVESQ